MNIRKSIAVQFALCLAAAVYSLVMASKMPNIVATHWNAAGQADQYGSKWLNLLMMPGIMLLMLGLTAVLPKLSPEKFKIDPFESTYAYVMILVNGLMLCMHVVIVEISAGAHLDITRTFMAVMFGFFALLGNVLGKLKPNFYMGIRTPWTLSDERVWHTTHRYAGRLWLVGGAIGVVASLCGLPFWASFTYLMLIALAPIVKSYVSYRRLNG